MKEDNNGAYNEDNKDNDLNQDDTVSNGMSVALLLELLCIMSFSVLPEKNVLDIYLVKPILQRCKRIRGNMFICVFSYFSFALAGKQHAPPLLIVSKDAASRRVIPA